MILNNEEAKTKRAHERLSRHSREEANGMGIIAFLLMALFGLKNEDLNTPQAKETLNKFSSALGLDSDDINQTVKDIQSGKTSAFNAAVSTAKNIDYSAVDWDKAAKALPPSSPIAPIEKIDIGTRQQLVIDTIPLAAKATGIDPDFMRGLWGRESSFGRDLVSYTGCEGDWQFSQGTWDDMMERYGDDIAKLIEKDYPEKAADLLANYKTRGSLNEYQYDPVISTYASAFLNKQNAKSLDIDPMQRESWGLLYAAYNAGAGSAMELRDIQNSGSNRAVMAEIGIAAKRNSFFYENSASANTALNRYQNEIEQRLDVYNQKLAHLETKQSPNQAIFNSGGVVVADKQQPDPLPFDGHGVDQIALAAKIDGQQISAKAQTSTAPQSFSAG